jgi:aminoglycoside 6'-N-acetyltransferase I
MEGSWLRDEMMTVREAVLTDRFEWLRMRCALWPGSAEAHDLETRSYFEQRSTLLVFIAHEGDHICGMLELDMRKYAPGCNSSPVPFIEGWYVKPETRHLGVGRALVEAAEDWARTHGFTEIGSDAEIENAGSIAAHIALGYTEVERIVCFRRTV